MSERMRDPSHPTKRRGRRFVTTVFVARILRRIALAVRRSSSEILIFIPRVVRVARTGRVSAIRATRGANRWNGIGLGGERDAEREARRRRT